MRSWLVTRGRGWRCVAVMFLALSGVLVVACGDDPYTGVWRATTARGDHVTIRIEKQDERWAIVDAEGVSRVGVQKDDRLWETDATGERVSGVSYQRVGDVLRQRVDGSDMFDFVKVE